MTCLLLPREVVVVLQIEQHLRAEIFRDVPVDARVVRRGVSAHQFHRAQYSWPSCESSDSHASRFNSLGKSGNWLNAILL